MPLVVEDGTGVSGAESYVSVADALVRLTTLGLDDRLAAETLEQQETRLRRASQMADGALSHWYETIPAQAKGQGLFFPRMGRDLLVPLVDGVITLANELAGDAATGRHRLEEWDASVDSSRRTQYRKRRPSMLQLYPQSAGYFKRCIP